MEDIPLEKQINPIESKSFHPDSPISVILLHHNVITNPILQTHHSPEFLSNKHHNQKFMD